MDKAIDRMAELIRTGMGGDAAASTAAREYGLTAGEVAEAAARRGADVAAKRRRERGVLTSEEIATLLSGRMTGPKFDPAVRRAVRRTVLAVMSVDRSMRNLDAECREWFGQLDDDAGMIYLHELYEIWRSLPPDLDPREVRRANIPASSFMWAALSQSATTRWIPNG